VHNFKAPDMGKVLSLILFHDLFHVLDEGDVDAFYFVEFQC